MTAILREQAPELPERWRCPPALHRILRHCLEKDPGERFQSARDLVFNLEAASDAHARCRRRAAAGSRSRWPSIAALAATALALTAVAGVRDGQRTAAPDERHEVSRHLPLHRFQRAGGVSGDCAGPEIGRVHGARQRVQADLRPSHGGRDAAADHEGCRRPRAAPLVARLELDHLLLAGGARDRKARSGRSPLSAARHGASSTASAAAISAPDGRIACFRVSGGQIELVTVSPEGDDVRSIARFPEAGVLQVPALVAGLEVDRLPAR